MFWDRNLHPERAIYSNVDIALYRVLKINASQVMERN